MIYQIGLTNPTLAAWLSGVSNPPDHPDVVNFCQWLRQCYQSADDIQIILDPSRERAGTLWILIVHTLPGGLDFPRLRQDLESLQIIETQVLDLIISGHVEEIDLEALQKRRAWGDWCWDVTLQHHIDELWDQYDLGAPRLTPFLMSYFVSDLFYHRVMRLLGEAPEIDESIAQGTYEGDLVNVPSDDDDEQPAVAGALGGQGQDPPEAIVVSSGEEPDHPEVLGEDPNGLEAASDDSDVPEVLAQGSFDPEIYAHPTSEEDSEGESTEESIEVVENLDEEKNDA